MDEKEINELFKKTLRILNDEYKEHCIENGGHNIQRFFLKKLATLQLAIDMIVIGNEHDKSK